MRTTTTTHHQRFSRSGAQMPGSGALVFSRLNRPIRRAAGPGKRHSAISRSTSTIQPYPSRERRPLALPPPTPHTPRRYKKRNTFHKHWLATGVASMAKGGRPRLHLLTTAPPVSPAAPGSTHLRVGVALTPAKGKRPTASAWALEAHDIGPGGAQPEFNQRSHCHLGCGF